jgi:hypothetical protein
VSLVPNDSQEQAATSHGADDYFAGIGVDPATVPPTDQHSQAEADIIQPDGHADPGSQGQHGGDPGSINGLDDSHGDSSHSTDHQGQGQNGQRRHDVDMSPPPEPPPEESHHLG